MKNKIHTSIIISLAIIISIYASPTYALGKAVFPNSKSSQPIPENVRPNISGNINSSVSTNSLMDLNRVQSEETPLNTVSPKANQPTNRISFYVKWVITGFFLITVIFIIYYKKRKII